MLVLRSRKPMSKPRVLMADDHAIVVEGLTSLLHDRYELLGAVGDGRTLIEAARKLKPDVILMDISLPGLNGIEATRRLAASSSRAKVIMLTMHADTSFATESLRAGARGYVLKHSAVTEIEKAIREVMQNRLYVTPALPRVRVQRDARRGGGGDLSPRQREVLQLVAEGRALKEIAAMLGISIKTVEFHKYRIVEQLGLRSTAELTAYAIRHGIVGAG
jgi:DNA-binding NarL/FixJ family response regulator